jgi:hypothetical protein
MNDPPPPIGRHTAMACACNRRPGRVGEGRDAVTDHTAIRTAAARSSCRVSRVRSSARPDMPPGELIRRCRRYRRRSPRRARAPSGRARFAGVRRAARGVQRSMNASRRGSSAPLVQCIEDATLFTVGGLDKRFERLDRFGLLAAPGAEGDRGRPSSDPRPAAQQRELLLRQRDALAMEAHLARRRSLQRPVRRRPCEGRWSARRSSAATRPRSSG